MEEAVDGGLFDPELNMLKGSSRELGQSREPSIDFRRHVELGRDIKSKGDGELVGSAFCKCFGDGSDYRESGG